MIHEFSLKGISMIRTYAPLLFFTTLVLCSGCGPSQTGGQSAETKEGAYITIKGSDTLVHLVTAWAEAYMEAHPGVEISVTGGGSGTGIAALLNGTTDICAASREMSQDEKTQAAGKGLQVQEQTVARDAIVVVVHPDNPVNALTLEQLAKIFEGAYVKWSDVGGGEDDIIVLSRESSSGTYAFFQEHVLKKQDYSPKARLMPATSAIVQAVAQDANAIGYVGLGYAAEAKGTVKAVGVKVDASALAVQPSEATVRDASYSVARALYFYVPAQATEAVKAFVQFCQGETGQQIVEENGFVPVQ